MMVDLICLLDFLLKNRNIKDFMGNILYNSGGGIDMKKMSYLMMSVLQILLIISAYVIQYFTVNRMGMMRHVMFTNQQWVNKYPVEVMSHVAVIFFVLILSLILYLDIKNDGIKAGRMYRILESVVLCSGVLIFILLNSTQTFLSYYFMTLLLCIVVMIQFLKHFLKLRWYKKKKV